MSVVVGGVSFLFRWKNPPDFVLERAAFFSLESPSIRILPGMPDILQNIRVPLWA